MEIDWSIVAFEVLNFAVLVAILRRFLFQPVQRTLAKRRQETDALHRQTEAREAAARATREEYEERLRELENRVNERIDEGIARGRAKSAELVEQGRVQARAMIESTEREAEQARARALENFRHEVFMLATDAATRVVQHMGVPSVARAYARRAAHALQDALEDRRLDAPVIIVTGEDVDPSEVEEEIATVLGEQVQLRTQIDPEIVAGVRLQAMGHEIEASASASLKSWYAAAVAGRQSEATASPFERTG